jgi:NAD(P)H-flavin reductase
MLHAETPPARDLAVPGIARIRHARREAPDVYTFELEPPDGATAFAFAPGQFNMLYLFGHGEVAISISGDPGRPDRLVHTIRAVGPITRKLTRLKTGDEIGVRGPFGSAWPVDAARGRDVVVVAGGLGLAPLRPVLYQLASQRAAYGRIALLYGTRTPRDLLFARQLDQWRRQAGWQVDVTVDAAARGWTGNVGVVTTLVPSAQFSPADAVAFVCGPELMMRFSIRALQARGLTGDQIFLSMERNMKCGVGFCGHCQFGPTFVCRDGPVFRYDRLAPWLGVREL